MGSRLVFFEDNEGTKSRLISGFTGDRAAAVLLALFWGAAAAQRSWPWSARVCSNDNPADCLTKDGLPQDHLPDGVWKECDLSPSLDAIVKALRADFFRSFADVRELFQGAFE